LIYDLCAGPAITDRVTSLLGPDIVLWSSNFWIKHPGGKEIPWHQDINYWPHDPPLNVTAWLAIDEATVGNSCVRIIPGSPKKALPHISLVEGKWFDEGADMSYVDESKVMDMELKPGEFFIFSERLLHQSNTNRSNKRRMGLSIRMTTPFVNGLSRPITTFVSGSQKRYDPWRRQHSSEPNGNDPERMRHERSVSYSRLHAPLGPALEAAAS
jgi:ectoine hydroxylase-related dioxygenase (phytanoyl-CoA dioxygenase family)